MSELTDGRNQRVSDSHAMSAVGAGLPQAFHRLAQATAKADGDHQVPFPKRANFVYNFVGRGGAGDREPQNDKQMFQKLHQISRQIAAQQDDMPGRVKTPYQGSDPLRIEALRKAANILDVLIE